MLIIELLALFILGTGVLLLLVDLARLPGPKHQPPPSIHRYEDDADFTLDEDTPDFIANDIANSFRAVRLRP
jgi:hypothetical protein